MKKVFLILFFALLFVSVVSAAEINAVNNSEIVKVYYFWQIGCSHCADVEASGILTQVEGMPNVNLEKYEIRSNQTSRQLFVELADKLAVPDSQRGTPFVVIEKDGKYSYLVGGEPVISGIVGAINNFQPIIINDKTNEAKTISLWAVVVAALVDALNPCALGVLAFLMISLLRLGSSKRALRAGIIYSFVVFFVYMLSGYGIFKTIQSFTSATHYIYLVAGLLVLILGGLQLIDAFFPGKFISLRIPKSAKPMIENIATKGTLPAIFLLGIIVALFELPCTGGIYIGILTLISSNSAHGLEYLIVYNLLFILPLLVATFIIYKGTSPQVVEKWSQGEKKWMKLASGIVMIALGIYMLWV